MIIGSKIHENLNDSVSVCHQYMINIHNKWVKWVLLSALFILILILECCNLCGTLFMLSGILYKGDGENTFISQQPHVIKSIMGKFITFILFLNIKLIIFINLK